MLNRAARWRKFHHAIAFGGRPMQM